jgi:hypothetical protein
MDGRTIKAALGKNIKAKALEVEVFELFKGDLVLSDSKELITRLSEDITNKLNLALENVFKQYLG